MNCKQAQTDIALWVGNDLSNNDIAPLERHVTICPPCREFHLRMLHVQKMLTNSNSRSSLEDSIWPALEEKIERQQQSFRRERFNGWIPAFAVAAACLMLLFFSRTISNLQQPEIPNFQFNSSPGIASAQWSDDDGFLTLLPEEEAELPPGVDSSYRNFDPKRAVDLSPHIPPMSAANGIQKNNLQLSPILY